MFCKLDHSRVTPVLKTVYERGIRSSPAIDGLIVISHRHYVLLMIAEKVYEFILCVVYVLIFINHYELEFLVQFVPRVGGFRQ